MALALSGTLLKTGEGFAGGRMAVLQAPDDAAPGSLASLTRFLLSRGIDCRPGYTGSAQAPVLRLSHFDSDAALLGLLREEFPRWQEQQDIPAAERVHIAADFQAAPLETAALEERKSGLGRFIAQHGNLLPALCYFLGDAGMFISGRKEKTGGPDKFKMFTAVAYSSAVADLLLFGGKADRPKTLSEVMQAVDPVFASPDGQKVADHIGARALTFLRRHPWEVNGLLNMAGASSHLISSAIRKSKGDPKALGEIISAVAMMTGQGVQTFVPEKHVDSFLRVGETLQQRQAAQAPLSDKAMLEAYANQSHDAFGQWMDWVRDKPMKVTALMSAGSNVSLGASGLIPAMKGKAVDKGLLTASGAYLTGNYLQSRTSKVKGPSFDDIVSAAAERIASVPLKEGDTQEKRIGRVAEALVRIPEVRNSPERVEAALRQRVVKGDGHFTSRFIGAETALLRQSPFVSPQLLVSAQGQAPVR